MRNQRGFTMIELIVVIVILGILAATALPKFIDVQQDARLAKAQGAAGAIKSASALAHAAYLVTGSSVVTIEGLPYTMVFGYPTITDITTLAGITSGDYDFVTAGLGLDVRTDSGHTSCKVTYTPPTSLGPAPTITMTSTRSDC